MATIKDANSSLKTEIDVMKTELLVMKNHIASLEAMPASPFSEGSEVSLLQTHLTVESQQSGHDAANVRQSVDVGESRQDQPDYSQTNYGIDAGKHNQAMHASAFGWGAGENSQKKGTVAVGSVAGWKDQGQDSVAVGNAAGAMSQNNWAVALGFYAGHKNQGDGSTAVGSIAGRENQGMGAIAVGNRAGEWTQGASAIAIGSGAGNEYQASEGIIITTCGHSTLCTPDISEKGHIHLQTHQAKLSFVGGKWVASPKLGNDAVDVSSIRAYIQLNDANPGYCLPWNSDGDLCKAGNAELASTCSNIDGNFYLVNCDWACAKQKCDDDSSCRGITSKGTGATAKYKLKSSVTSVSPNAEYACWRKTAL